MTDSLVALMSVPFTLRLLLSSTLTTDPTGSFCTYSASTRGSVWPRSARSANRAGAMKVAARNPPPAVQPLSTSDAQSNSANPRLIMIRSSAVRRLASAGSEIDAEPESQQHLVGPVPHEDADVAPEERPAGEVSLEAGRHKGTNSRPRVGAEAASRFDLTAYPRHRVEQEDRLAFLLAVLPRHVDARRQVRMEPGILEELVLLRYGQVPLREVHAARPICVDAVHHERPGEVVLRAGGRPHVDFGFEMLGPIEPDAGGRIEDPVRPVVERLAGVGADVHPSQRADRVAPDSPIGRQQGLSARRRGRHPDDRRNRHNPE